MPTSNAMPKNLKFSHRLTLYSVLSLMFLYTIINLTAETINWTVLLVPLVTLVVFIPGIYAKTPRSFDWLCFVILLHFTVGVTSSMSPQAAWHDYLQTLLSVVIFIAAMMTSRWLKAWQATDNSQPSTH